MKKDILLGVVFLAAGIALAVWGFMNLSTALQSKAWPTAEGKITSSTVVKKIERYTDSDHHRRTRTIYTPQLRYSYAADGRTLIGSRITLSDSGSSSESRARKISRRYPAGSTCTVFYNPDNPAESLLKAGITFGTLLFPAMGVLFAVVGLGVLILGRKAAPAGKG